MSEECDDCLYLEGKIRAYEDRRCDERARVIQACLDGHRKKYHLNF